MNSCSSKNSAQHPIRMQSIVIGNLVYECLQAGHSLRLLAALLDTKSFGVVYQSMISSKTGRGGKRGPTPQNQKIRLKKNAQHLLEYMILRKITPRRWCSAYQIPFDSFLDPLEYDDPIVIKLQEDFPEAYGFELPPYAHAYEEVQAYHHIHCKKNNVHIYKLSNGTKMVSRSKGKALGLASKLQGLIYQTERLRVLLERGTAAALEWTAKKMMVEGKLSEEEVRAMEQMRRTSEINDVIDELRAIPNYHSSSADQARKEFLYNLLIQRHGMTKEKINNDVQHARWKAGRY